MLKNYFTVALRQMWRQKGYTFLNIFGLTIGLTSALVILLYVSHELSFDTHHEKAERIFRISADVKEPDNAFKWAVTQYPLGPKVKENFPEVEEYVRFVPNDQTKVEIDDQVFLEEKFYYVDSTVFDIFTFHLIQGDVETALDAPNSILLNKSLANKMFGSPSEAMNKMMDIGREQAVKVTGVFEDMPTSSHLIANALISTSTLGIQGGSWGAFGFYNYVLLSDPQNAAQFESKLQEIIEAHVTEIFDQFNINIKYELQPILDIHLTSVQDAEPEPRGNKAYIYIFTVVGIFMLLIACINYMNLATAHSSRRAREVGVRKVLGSFKAQLIGQFFTESIIFTLFAMVLSLGFLFLVTPVIEGWLDLELPINLLLDPIILLSIGGIFLLAALLSGSYPAFFLSSFEPVKVLKGLHLNLHKGISFRKVLVTIQFAISLGLLVCTGIVYNQLNFLQEKDLGFTQDAVVRFMLDGRAIREKWPVLRDQFMQIPHVEMVGTASNSPGTGIGKQVMFVETNEGVMDSRGVDNFFVDFEYIPTMEMELVQGRNFSAETPSDSSQAILVNEAFVKRMSWDNPIGKRVQFAPIDTLPYSYVIGVVKDFHQRSLYHKIEPMLLRPGGNNGMAHIRLNTLEMDKTLDDIERAWTEIIPNVPLEYEFLDDAFAEQYSEDQRRSKIFTLFTFLTIIIACLGLMGLASFATEQRIREIGIRKILGASLQSLIVLLTKEFSLLVLISVVFAFPLAWYVMNEWLHTFEYFQPIGPGTFILSLLITLLLTWMTTGYHALKAARSNLVRALRTE